MKRNIILAISLFIFSFVFISLVESQEGGDFEIDIRIDQSTLDSIDFDNINLLYQYNQIRLYKADSEWTLETSINYLNVHGMWTNESSNITYYEIQWGQTFYQYQEQDFFDCIVNGTNTDVECFETLVVPLWTPQFEMNDRLQRRYLKSFQTGGEPMLDEALTNYLQ